jgi:hypothetical protein
MIAFLWGLAAGVCLGAVVLWGDVALEAWQSRRGR